MIRKTYTTVLMALLAVFMIAGISEAAPKRVVQHRVRHSRVVNRRKIVKKKVRHARRRSKAAAAKRPRASTKPR